MIHQSGDFRKAIRPLFAEPVTYKETDNIIAV